MKSELLLVLVSVCAFRWRHDVAAALPVTMVQVRLGQAATLQCPLLDAAARPAAPSTLSWYRKSPGQSPTLLLVYRSSGSFTGTHGGGADPGNVTHGAGVYPGNVTRGAGVDPGKVSVAADGSLLLHASSRSDTAVYYCGVSQGTEQKKKNTSQEVTGN